MPPSEQKNPHDNTDPQDSPEQLRRSFLKKFGKYAVSTPAVTFTLMSSMTSKAIASGGDDSAPYYQETPTPYESVYETYESVYDKDK